MKKMNKKGFTLVELLAVIVILAILMAIAATNIGPVIDNSRKSSMRTTAQMIIDAVQTQLTTNYELYPGIYQFNTAILDKGGIVAPFGGEYNYVASQPEGSTKIGSGIFRIRNTPIDTLGSGKEWNMHNYCGKSSGASGTVIASFVNVERQPSTGSYKFSICLTTKNLEGGILVGTREQVDNTKDDQKDLIFCGKSYTLGNTNSKCSKLNSITALPTT